MQSWSFSSAPEIPRGRTETPAWLAPLTQGREGSSHALKSAQRTGKLSKPFGLSYQAGCSKVNWQIFQGMVSSPKSCSEYCLCIPSANCDPLNKAEGVAQNLIPAESNYCWNRLKISSVFTHVPKCSINAGFGCCFNWVKPYKILN